MGSLFSHVSPADAIGLLGLVLSAAAGTCKSDRRMRSMITLSALIWGAHWYLIGAKTAAAVSLVSSARHGTAQWTQNQSKVVSRRLLGVFSVISLTTGLYLWSNWTSSIPLCASLWSTYGYFRFKGLKLRKWSQYANAFWLTNAIALGSIPALATSALIITTNFVGQWRLRRTTLASA